MLAAIRIVLVEPSHPGNIGAAARAMKTMGLQSLCLVKPRVLPNEQSTALAAGAQDVLQMAHIQPSLLPMIADCGLVIGLSARSRTLDWPMLTPPEASALAVQEMVQHPVAFLFGNEQHGLTNKDLQHCHYQVTIPTDQRYSSLNIAMAVQIIAYEIYQAHYLRQENLSVTTECVEYPAMSDLEKTYQHVERVLQKIGFLRPQGSGQIMPRLRCLLTKARLQSVDINLLRGILAMIEKKIIRE